MDIMAKLILSALLSLILYCTQAQVVVEYREIQGKKVSTYVACKTKVKSEEELNSTVRDMISKLKFATKLHARHYYLYVLKMYDFDAYGGDPQQVLDFVVYDTNHFLNRMYGSRVQNMP